MIDVPENSVILFRRTKRERVGSHWSERMHDRWFKGFQLRRDGLIWPGEVCRGTRLIEHPGASYVEVTLSRPLMKWLDENAAWRIAPAVEYWTSRHGQTCRTFYPALQFSTEVEHFAFTMIANRFLPD